MILHPGILERAGMPLMQKRPNAGRRAGALAIV